MKILGQNDFGVRGYLIEYDAIVARTVLKKSAVEIVGAT